MIYTLTFNASLDYYAHADSVEPGAIHKLTEYEIFPGGKGINVSQILGELEIDNIAWSFVAGTTGVALENMLERMNIAHDFIMLKQGITRINVKLRTFNEEGLCETDFNGIGPVIDNDAVSELKEKILKLCENDIVIISGSIPESITEQIFEDILKEIQKAGAMLVADVTGKYLELCLKYKPFFVKPNNLELADFLDTPIDSYEDAKEAGKLLISKGAVNVLISMGAKGAVLCTRQGEMFTVEPPKGKVVSTIGAGDSMVAGFVAAYVSGKNMQESLRQGVCAGSATAFCVSLAKGNSIKRLLDGFNI